MTHTHDTMLSVEHLRVEFSTDSGTVLAVRDVTWSAPKGQTVALVGESGCGKTATALAILGLLPQPQGRITAGRIEFDGCDLSRLSEDDLRRVRGRRIAMIFQEPMTALNPVWPVGEQIAEVARRHLKHSRREARRLAIDMLRRVDIHDPRRCAGLFPHELSGGMRQRAMIAMALCCGPELLIADEPSTALDTTTQGQILDLLKTLQRETGMTLIVISHDFGVVAELAHVVHVIYAGRIVESAGAADLLRQPLHPYTRSLMQCLPRPSRGGPSRRQPLPVIEGSAPASGRLPSGCAFHPRCALTQSLAERGADDSVEIADGERRVRVLTRCVKPPGAGEEGPALREARPGHFVACPEDQT